MRLRVVGGRFRAAARRHSVRQRSTGEQSTNWYWGKFSGDTITGQYTTDFSGEIRTNDWRALRGD